MKYFRTILASGFVACLTLLTYSPLHAEILFKETFESNSLNANAEGNDINTIGFNWQNPNRTSIVTGGPGENAQSYSSFISVNDDRDWSAKEGLYSMRFRYVAGTAMAEQRFDFEPQSSLWIRYWVRVPTNYSHGTGGGGAVNNKFLSLWMDGYEGQGDGSTFWLSMESAGSGDTNLAFTYTTGMNTGSVAMQQHFNFIDASQDRGRWMQILIHLKSESSSGSSDGTIETWRKWDGETSYTRMHSKYDVPFREPSSPKGFAEGYLMGWANGSYSENTEWLLDELTISNTSLLDETAPQQTSKAVPPSSFSSDIAQP